MEQTKDVMPPRPVASGPIEKFGTRMVVVDPD